MNKLNVIFFGPPGVGKGTQALKISKHYGLIHVSTGDILRNEIKLETQLGKTVKDIMGRGELVSDGLLIRILERTCEFNEGSNGFVFDGFPRTIPQAHALDELVRRNNCNIHKVISLEVNEEELLRRLVNRAVEQGRTDDTEEVIKKRLVVYHQHTKPLIEYYRKKGIFVEMNGVGTIDAVFHKICQVIEAP